MTGAIGADGGGYVNWHDPQTGSTPLSKESNLAEALDNQIAARNPAEALDNQIAARNPAEALDNQIASTKGSGEKIEKEDLLGDPGAMLNGRMKLKNEAKGIFELFNK